MTDNNFPIVHAGSALSAISESHSTFESANTYGIITSDSPCPPINARNDEVVAYRLVSNSPPVKEDFLPAFMEYPHRDFKPWEFCISRGVSVFTNENAIHKKRKRYKNLQAKLIAIGNILREDGRVLETCSKYHMTWWLETDTPHRNFKLLAQS